MNEMNSTTQAGPVVVTVGVDTHQLTHHAALLDAGGRELGDREFPATQTGYEDLMGWAAAHGAVESFGVESTGTYGAGLAAHLIAAGQEAHEVARPDKTTRAMLGKSDPIDAYAAARAVQAGRAAGWVKVKDGPVESIRVIKLARDSAVKDRTAAISQLRDVITTAPEPLRAELLGLSAAKRVTKVLGYRPDPARAYDSTQAVKLALRALARRIAGLNEEIAEADKILTALVAQHLPHLVALRQVGTQIAAQLAITAGQNIDRMRSEAAFAKLTGVAPVPASSGKTRRMRLNRGGDRQANSALYMIVVGRMRNHPETLAYRTRREAEGLSKKDIIRCLKRYVARETYNALKTDLATT
jgi:transposase